MRWLIVEDALRNRDGHYFEYISTFWRELRKLGDEVTVLVDRDAEPFIVDGLSAHRVLPPSIWPRLSDGSGRLRRYSRVPGHGFATYRAMSAWLKKAESPDVIFVPSVSVHHLLGWAGLIKWSLRSSSARVLLFFPSVPLTAGPDGRAEWQSAPTTRLLDLLLRWLRPEIEAGRVILGAETAAMQGALTQLTGLPFVYFPHPVVLSIPPPEEKARNRRDVLMACYGPARAEKGSDVLREAIVRFLDRFPETQIRFAIQWLGDFRDAAGAWVSLPDRLRQDRRVTVIDRYFGDGEYHRWLARTAVMFLPYRRVSYAWRLSRVLIESVTTGIPVIVTRGTTLAEQAGRFGAAVLCEDEDVESVVAAIRYFDLHYEALQAAAQNAREMAQTHFSVSTFREILLARFAASSSPMESAPNLP